MNASPISLDQLPDTSELHSWTDYIELLALFNMDREVSKQDVIDRLQERRDLGETIPHIASTPNDARVIADDLDALTEDLFRYLEHRTIAFGNSYPFRIDNDRKNLIVRPTSKTRRLYAFLLVAASLRYFKQLIPSVTTDFETLSKVALQEILPTYADTHFFHGAGRSSNRYHGKLFTKVVRLSTDLGEHVIVEEKEFRDADVGDGGLDLVGWVSLKDPAAGRPLYFCQCACTPQWVTKQHSASAEQWRQTLTFKSPPLTISFIPFCYRTPQGDWYASHKVVSILIDRLRFINIVGPATKSLANYNSIKKVTQLLKRAEPSV